MLLGQPPKILSVGIIYECSVMGKRLIAPLGGFCPQVGQVANLKVTHNFHLRKTQTGGTET